MTVAELIEKLKEMDPAMIVAVYDGGPSGRLVAPRFMLEALEPTAAEGEYRYAVEMAPEGQPAVIL